MCSIALAALLAAIAPRGAWAQDKAAAEQLFKEGRALMKAKKYGAACGKFAASHQLDPAIGTLLNLATCYEKQGKVASAWARFAEAEDKARLAFDEKRKRYAHKRARALQKRLPWLKVVAPGDIEGLQVHRNGEVVNPALLGTAVPVDPGTHHIVARAPGYKPFETSVTAREGKRITVTIPKLVKETRPVIAKRTRSKTPRRVVEPARRGGKSKPRGQRRRITGASVAAIGLVATGVGLVFGAQARSTWNRAFDDGHCNSDNVCDQTGFDLTEDARGKATLSTIFVGVGLAAVGVGSYLYFTAPRGKKPRIEASVTGRGAFIGVTGGF